MINYLTGKYIDNRTVGIRFVTPVRFSGRERIQPLSFNQVDSKSIKIVLHVFRWLRVSNLALSW